MVNKEPAGVYRVEFKSDLYEDTLKTLGILIQGQELSRVISGTGVVIDDLSDNLVITSNKGEWQPNLVDSPNLVNNIKDTYNRYSSKFNVDDYEEISLDLEFLQNNKKFSINIGDEFKTLNSYMLITNKMLKNFNKETTNVSIAINRTPILFNESELEETCIKIIRITVDNTIAKTTCYHALIDKTSTNG